MNSQYKDALELAYKELDTEDERNYFNFHRYRYGPVLEMIDQVSDGTKMKVLDVGCYPFHIGTALESMGHEVYGVASKHENVDRERIIQCDIETDPLDFENDQFDAIVFSEVIEHLPHSPVPVLREMNRVIKPGGKLILTTPNFASGSKRVKFLFGKTIMYPLHVYFEHDGKGELMHHRHNREYLDHELRELLEQTGWKIEDNGFMVSWSGWQIRRAGSPTGKAKQLVKYWAEKAVPFARDNQYFIATK